MEPGLIYILVNPCMKGIVKIGMTTRTAEDRASEISIGTGVPTPYEVAYEERFADCYTAETVIHQRLKDYRVNQDREFFCLPLKEAIRSVSALAEELNAKEKIKAEMAAAEQSAAIKIEEEAQRREKTRADQFRARRFPPRVQSVQLSKILCSYCSTAFKVTLRRGERATTCPACRKLNSVSVPW